MRPHIVAGRRWNWINGWLTAALHACIGAMNLRPNNTLSIDELLSTYSQEMRRKLQNVPVSQPVEVEEWELKYIFHLEEELWGPDADTYRTFFPSTGGTNAVLLQTFHFVLLFYIVERCLELFVKREDRHQIGHGRLRRKIFGHEDGLLSKRALGATQAMGLPFSLVGQTSSVEVVGSSQSEWDALKRLYVPKPLKRFYQKTTGKSHFADILEAALKQARRDFLREKFGKSGKRLDAGVRAWWYDVLWRYSESVRYHALIPVVVSSPFYWNRAVRWFGSVIITGLLLVADHMGAPVMDVWQDRMVNSRIARLLGQNGRF